MYTRGFTLVELVIVICLTSIMGVIAALNMPSLALFQTRGFAGVLMHDLILTKSLSISENQRYRIAIGANSYQIQDQNGVAIMHPETNASAIVYATGVTVPPTITLIFDSMGKPYDGSGTALSSTLNLTVSSAGVNRVVSVSPQTGLIQ